MKDIIHADFLVHLGEFKLAAKFQTRMQGITVIFGASGSGKSTILNCLSGILKCRGSCQFGQEVWLDSARDVSVPVYKRNIGQVFQDARLFPHLNVRDNILYSQKFKKYHDPQERLQRLAQWLKITHLLKRQTYNLSGGERQRVALARTLFASPRLLLMDEPLASLDMQAKREIIGLIESIKEKMQIPIIYITHSIDEVLRLADHVIVIENGEVKASGTLEEMKGHLMQTPQLELEPGVIITGVVSKIDENFQLATVKFGDGELLVPNEQFKLEQKVVLRILAKNVSLTKTLDQQTSILNILPVKVASSVEDDAFSCLIELNCGATTLRASITKKSNQILDIQPGQELLAQIKSVGLHR